jgi:hypothetical protein
MLAPVAADRSFDEGTLTLVCRCVDRSGERLAWRHILDVPRGGLRINLDAVCASTRDEYPDPKSMCSGLFGVLAYSFQPARHR